jgi:hypothetical protein
MIKTYLKYLWANPWKLAWIIAANAIIGAFAFYFFKDISAILEDGTIWVILVCCIIITGVRIAVTLQPFIEWRDGQNRK